MAPIGQNFRKKLAMLDTKSIRADFPAIRNHPGVIYFDNASTSQKPQTVLDAVSEYHHSFCSNPHRSIHDWGLRSTQTVEKVRTQLAGFLGLNSTKGLFFSSGATEASSLLGLHFCQQYLQDGDEIIISKEEHKTLASSWQRAFELTGKKVTIKSIKLDPEGDYNTDDLKNKVTSKTKLIILSHIHNVFGIEMGLEEARKVIPDEIPIILDATQSIGHISVEPEKLGVQCIYFSAHKIFGFSGIGAVWLDEKYLSESIGFERGSLNVEGIISLGAAITYIEKVGLQTIEHHLLDLTQYALQNLRQIPGIEFLPGPAYCTCATGYGILSFRKEGISSLDLAQWLNEHQIYVRSGKHCSDSKKAEDSVRLSFQIYSTREEIDKLIKVLKET